MYCVQIFVITIYLMKLLNCQCISLSKVKLSLLKCSDDLAVWIPMSSTKSGKRIYLYSLELKNNDDEPCKSTCLKTPYCTLILLKKDLKIPRCFGYYKFQQSNSISESSSDGFELACCIYLCV
ncbi:unnamed protein product [Schistosoma spindalis]|nr:unnamed protein product [Schistosoma spindale]